jgi:hypothetical protein
MPHLPSLAPADAQYHHHHHCGGDDVGFRPFLAAHCDRGAHLATSYTRLCAAYYNFLVRQGAGAWVREVGSRGLLQHVNRMVDAQGLEWKGFSSDEFPHQFRYIGGVHVRDFP